LKITTSIEDFILSVGAHFDLSLGIIQTYDNDL